MLEPQNKTEDDTLRLTSEIHVLIELKVCTLTGVEDLTVLVLWSYRLSSAIETLKRPAIRALRMYPTDLRRFHNIANSDDIPAIGTVFVARPTIIHFVIYDKWNNIPHFTQTEKYGREPCEPSLTSYYAHHSWFSI